MINLLKRLIAICCCVWLLFSQAACAEDALTVLFLDVGQADAALLMCGGETLLIDGGNAADSSFLYSLLKNTLGLSHIDYMIATHPHEDHVGGLAGALNACSVGKLYSPVADDDSRAFGSLLKYAAAYGVAPTIPHVGDSFDLGSAQVQFLSPAFAYASVNDLSIVVRVVCGDVSFLFTGDAEWASEHDMVASGLDLRSTVLKVGHHGSAASSSYVFLREVMPQYAIISVGADNNYGHPTEEVLSRLTDTGAMIFRTDLHGTIGCVTDGSTLTFYTERQVDDHGW